MQRRISQNELPSGWIWVTSKFLKDTVKGWSDTTLSPEFLAFKYEALAILDGMMVLLDQGQPPDYIPRIVEIKAPVTYFLEIYVSPLGSGSVSPASGQYEAGTRVTLTATPASGYTFDNWAGDTRGTSRTVTITIDTDKVATAVFVLVPPPPEIPPPPVPPPPEIPPEVPPEIPPFEFPSPEEEKKTPWGLIGLGAFVTGLIMVIKKKK